MAPAWTHLGYAVPSGVFAQEQLDLFEPAEDDA
jgi:Holliday junction DNA helicase RuvB